MKTNLFYFTVMNQLTLTEINTIQDNALQTMLTETLPGHHYKAAHALYDVYAGITGVTAFDHSRDAANLATGVAISSSAAAHCLLEFGRTTAFLRGIRKAITDLQERFPGERLHVLYAGCGPYATLLTPLLRLYEPSLLSIDMLDISTRSIESVKHLYATLGLEAYVNDYIVADAISYQVNKDRPVHLLISETLNAALRNEPFVSIMQNLVPQLAEGAAVVPQQVVVDAVYLNMKEETKRMTTPGMKTERITAARLASFDKEHLATPAPVSFVVPGIDPIACTLYLLTLIDVYKGERIQENECSLTIPMRVKLFGAAPGDEIKMSYRVNEKPGFVAELVKR